MAVEGPYVGLNVSNAVIPDKANSPAIVEVPKDQPNITVEDMVQKNFIKFPDSQIHESKSLKNYTRLPANHQQNLNKMRKAE